MPCTPLGIADIMKPDDLSAVTICTKVSYLEQGTDDDNTKQTRLTMFATSSKSSTTTQQQLPSGPPVDTCPL